MTASHLSTFRTVLLALTGLSCVIYALLAGLQNRPDPIGWYLPGLIGGTAAVLITIAAFVAGQKAAQIATDELYHMVNGRAQRHAYWASMALLVLVAVLAKQEAISWATAFAVLGTLMGASYLLLFVFYEWRLR